MWTPGEESGRQVCGLFMIMAWGHADRERERGAGGEDAGKLNTNKRQIKNSGLTGTHSFC